MAKKSSKKSEDVSNVVETPVGVDVAAEFAAMHEEPVLPFTENTEQKSVSPSIWTETTDEEFDPSLKNEKVIDVDTSMHDYPAVEPEGDAAEPTEEVTPYDNVLDAIRRFDAGFATQHAKETPFAYMHRLIKFLNKACDAIPGLWESLGEDGPEQVWYNDSVDLVSGEKPKPPLIISGYETKPPKTKFSVEVANNGRKVIKKASRVQKDPNAPPKKRGRPFGSKNTVSRPRSPRKNGKTWEARKLVLANHDKSYTEVLEMSKAAGYMIKDTSLSSLHSDVRAFIRAAEEIGLQLQPK